MLLAEHFIHLADLNSNHVTCGLYLTQSLLVWMFLLVEKQSRKELNSQVFAFPQGATMHQKRKGGARVWPGRG